MGVVIRCDVLESFFGQKALKWMSSRVTTWIGTGIYVNQLRTRASCFRVGGSVGVWFGSIGFPEVVTRWCCHTHTHKHTQQPKGNLEALELASQSGQVQAFR